MKKLLMGGALLGSTVMFGNLLSPMLSRKVSADSQNSAIAYSAQVSNLLPKPARQPSMLHVGSIHDGTASLQLAVIAGILARNQPQIYLTDSSFVDNNLEQSLSRHYGVTFNKSSNTAKLVSQFGNQACGSPARWIRFNNSHGGSTLAQNEAVDQLNAVRTLCGVYDALPVPAGQTPPISHQSSPLYDISPWGHSVPLYQKVWNLVSHSVTKQWIAISPPNSGSLRLNMTDYIAMSKAFAFQVPLSQLGGSYSSVAAQKNFAASVINSYPIPFVVLGYTGIGQPGGGSNEVDFVSAVSGGSHAQSSALAGSSPAAHGGGYYTGSQLVTNMSAKSAFSPFSGARFPNPAATPGYSSSHKYITIIASQGDCLDWTEKNIASYMLRCQQAGMPIGLTVTLTAQWLDPGIMHWYIDNIGNNSGVISSGSAGVGYNHVSQMPNASQFLSTGASLAAVSNVKDFFFIEGPGANPMNNAGQYISGLKNGGVNPRALWWWNNSGSPPAIISGIPSFFAALNISQTNLTSQAECNTAISHAISSAHSNFIMFFLNTTWPDPAYLKSACASHGCTPLSPGTFANLFRKAHGLPEI